MFSEVYQWASAVFCDRPSLQRNSIGAATKMRNPKLVGSLSMLFFCSNALIALARSLCKCFLAELITVGEADV